MDAFEAFNQEMFGDDGGIDSLLDLFSKTRVAEMASYAQIAWERITAIQKLEKVVREDGDEPALQRMVSQAPWLIDPTRIDEPNKSTAYEHWESAKQRIVRISWTDFLARAVQANETFLDAHHRVREEEMLLSAVGDLS